MKNEHLVPVNVIDLVNKINDKNIRENEHQNYVLRVEAIRDYCDESLKRNINKISAVPNKKVRR